MVTVSAYVSTSALTGAVGGLIFGSSPVTAGTEIANPYDIASCSIGRVTGITLDAGYTQMGAGIVAGQNAIFLVEMGSCQSQQSLMPTTNWPAAGTTEFMVSCTYHE